MKKCLNCNFDVRDTDRYCRNCGCYLQSNKSYIIFNVISIILIFIIILLVVLFAMSYLI